MHRTSFINLKTHIVPLKLVAMYALDDMVGITVRTVPDVGDVDILRRHLVSAFLAIMRAQLRANRQYDEIA